MPDPNTFESRLVDAMRRYSDGAPTHVDAMALAREIASASTKETSQRPRWWPFGRTHLRIDHEPGRSRTMFIATGTTAAIAVAAITGGLALSSVVSGPDQPSPPVAEAPDVGEEWSFFRGTLRFDGSPVLPTETIVQDGLVIQRGGGWSGQTIEADDARMSGERTEISNSWEDLAGGAGGIWTNLLTIENEEGSWSCPVDGAWVSDGDLGSESGWCDGAGAYEGLRAFVVFDLDGGGPMTSADFYGYITSGDGPAAVEPPGS